MTTSKMNPTHRELFKQIEDMELPEDIRLKVEDVLASDNEATEENKETENFMDCYIALRETVTALKQMQEPDVDAIIPLVEKGMKAYKGCEARIKQVEGYLAALDGASAD
jgi:exonuclease VII small subunit